MFDLDAEVRRWRKHAEGKSSLSPREVDELEDHLRARVDLELELDSAMTPAQAFALASEDVGEPAALSREFVRAGRPRWRRLLVAAWAMFAVSWFLPALVEYKPVPFAPDGTFLPHAISGWDAFGWALFGWAGPVGSVSALTNLLMLVTGLRVYRKRASKARWAALLLVVAAAVNALYWPSWVMSEGDMALRLGFVAWAGSFALGGTALWLRARGWVSALPETASA